MPTLYVVAAILCDDKDRVLIAQRLAGTHMAGRWEFPGGKLEPGEARYDGLVRELDEELGVQVLRAEPLIELTHDYPDRRVHLDVWRVTGYTGRPRALEGQALKWVDVDRLDAEDILEADAPIIEALNGER